MIIKDSNNVLDILPSIEINYDVSDIPVVENKRLNTNIVRFKDIELISENTGLSYKDIIQKIKLKNKIDNLNIIMNEEEVFLHPKFVMSFNENICAKSLSLHSYDYKVIDTALTECIYNHDNTLLKQLFPVNLLEELLIEDEQPQQQTQQQSGDKGFLGKLTDTFNSVKNTFQTKSKELLGQDTYNKFASAFGDINKAGLNSFQIKDLGNALGRFIGDDNVKKIADNGGDF